MIFMINPFLSSIFKVKSLAIIRSEITIKNVGSSS